MPRRREGRLFDLEVDILGAGIELQAEDGDFYAGNFCDADGGDRCMNEMSGGRMDAISRCEEYSGQGCLIFATNGRIQVPYEIRP